MVRNVGTLFIFAPLLNIFWGWQRKRAKEPSSVVKMGMGCVLVGSAYILMILAAKADRGYDDAVLCAASSSG